MTINLEEEISSSRYDKLARMHSYTIERDGKRWTVNISDDEFAKFGFDKAGKMGRRTLLAQRLTSALQGVPDAR